MSDSDVIKILRLDNTAYIMCPNLSALDDVRDTLTFHRRVSEMVRWQRRFRLQREDCFNETDDPYTVSCPAGFTELVVNSMGSRYDVSIQTKISKRVRNNLVVDWSRIGPDVVFRPKQMEIIKRVVSAQRGRIVVPTAVGKSFIILQLAKIHSKARIIVSTYARPVLNQIYNSMLADEQLCDEVGICGSGKKKNLGARVVCVGLDSLRSYLPTAAHTTQDIDLFLLDEYHEGGTPKRLEVLKDIRQAKMIGFSANDKREDGAEFVLNGIFGKELFSMTYGEACKLGLVTPITVIWMPVKSDIDPAAAYVSDVEQEKHGLWRFHKRNKAIAKAVDLFDEDDQIVISVKTLDQALHIRKHLPDFAVAYSTQDEKTSNVPSYQAKGLMKGMPEMTSKLLEKMQNDFVSGKLKRVIATSVWSRGMNFTDLAVLIRADGQATDVAATQWPGRTSRIADGKGVSVVVDFTDEYNPRFRRKALDREKHYKQKEWSQVHYEDLGDVLEERGLAGE